MSSKYETRIDLEDKNSSHTLIVELVGHDKRILDVGCAAGDLAEVLTRHGCRVTGIELDPEAAQKAREHCEKVVVADVEDFDPSAELGESFDVIVFGDVLEHLKDPLRTLNRLEPLLGPEGYAVASIPNVAHGSVRLALMQGKFRYSPLGLLDDTHLRFFTRESVEQMFEEAGLLITELRRTSRDIFGTEIVVDRESVPEEVLRLVQKDPEASTYQFVIKAHRLGDTGALAKKIKLLSEQLEERDRIIYDLNRKLRNFEELKRLLDERTEQLADKEKEVTRLAQEAADRNDRLARMVQFGREDA